MSKIKAIKVGNIKYDLSVKAENILYLDSASHAYVDLGLPSGTLWATMNVGAESETDSGNFYGYGQGSDTYSYNLSMYTGNEDPLLEEYDTAAQVWGNGWYTPTKDQFDELVNNTTFTVETDPDDNTTVIAGKFTAENGNYIILPAVGQVTPNPYDKPILGTGYYQTSTPIENLENNVSYVFEFNNTEADTNTGSRTCGYKVRPVHNSFDSSLSSKEDLSNKVTALSAQNTHTEYPSAKAVYDNLPTTMGASGSGHKGGLVPDTSSTAGTTKFLREDGTWEVPAYTAAQVQSDWNATSGMGAILNKPTIPTVPTNVSAFTNDAGYLTSHQDISGKEDKMPISTQSSNFTATVGNYYKVDIGASVSRTITLTTPSDSTKVSNCIFYVTTSTSPSLTISAASGVTVYFSDNYSIEASSNYEINALWNGTAWFITSVKLKNNS